MARRVWSSVLAVGAALALTTAFSCKTFDLPAETCNPSTLHTTRASGEDDCGRCLEDHCCDAVGVCERQSDCANIVRNTQSCVVTAGVNGAREEKACAEESGLTRKQEDRLVNPEADGAYRCMRGQCGAQCGLPVCKVDKAALLIRNAKCDQCFAGGCCAPLNRCYESRACKLMLECIITTCGPELGTSLEDRSSGPPDGSVNASGDTEALCADPPPQHGTGIPECVRACLCAYRGNDQGLPPEDPRLLPMNLAEAVYACGKEAECGKDCKGGPGDASAD